MRGRIAGSALLGIWLAASCGAPVSFAHAGDTASVRVTIAIKPVAWIDFPDGFDFHLIVPKSKHDDKHGKGHDHGKGKGHDHGKGKGHDYDDEHEPIILPVVIPFKVVGNAHASVSAKPETFLRLKSGAYLGKAVTVGGSPGHDDHGHGYGKGKGHDDHGHGYGKGHDHGHSNPQLGANSLGYNIIMQFPMTSWHHANPDNWPVFLASYASGFATLPGIDGQGTRPLTANLAQRPGGTYGVLYIVSRAKWTADGKEATEGIYGGSVELTLTPLNN